VASERVDWILAVVEKYNAGDVEGFLDEFGPSFEFSPDPSFPDAGTYSGERLRRWMLEWAHTWQDNRLEVFDSNERDDVVVVGSRWHLAAPQGGAEVPNPEFWFVVWFDRDTIHSARRSEAYFDRGRAFEAAGFGTG
jgi:hypothetical protein